MLKKKKNKETPPSVELIYCRNQYGHGILPEVKYRRRYLIPQTVGPLRQWNLSDDGIPKTMECKLHISTQYHSSHEFNVLPRTQ